MTTLETLHPNSLHRTADRALRGATTFWFLVTAVGQWIFLTFVAAYFVPILWQGGLAALGGTHLPNGYVEGQVVGNMAIAAHLLLAVILLGGGPLQLIPQLRRRSPTLHRWIGRVYASTAALTSLAGLYVAWTRGVVGGPVMRLAITLEALLILLFVVLAVRSARARDLGRHRRQALRLFMVCSGVWFFRIGFLGWILVTGGVGVDFEAFGGPFLRFWAFGHYLLPLALLEVYLWLRQGAEGRRLALAAGLTVLTGAMGVGIFAATMGLWLPRMGGG